MNPRPSVYKTAVQWRDVSVAKPLTAQQHAAEGAGGQASAVHRGQLGDRASELENNLPRGLLWPLQNPALLLGGRAWRVSVVLSEIG